jgi:PAS domain S-box-containing protein
VSTSSRILVVEDDFLLSLDLAEKLAAMGCEVAGTAHNGHEALKLAKELKPDLAVMDIELEGDLDGIATAEKIKAECRIPIVFLTGHSDETTLKRAARSGAFGHLVKPVRTEELKTTISLALEQSRAWRDLLSRNSWLANMLGSIDEGVVAIDLAGRITYLNSQAEYMTGWALPEVSGQPVEMAYLPVTREGKPLPVGHLRGALANGTSANRERLSLRARNGREIPVEETVMTIWNNGRIDGAIAIFRDLTDMLKLQEADKLQTIGTLAGGVAHDFNNLLAVIVGNASLVRERLPEDGRDRPFLDEIVKAGAKAAELTSQLLSYAGKANSRKKSIDISRLIRDTEALIRTVVPDAIRIRMETPDGLPLIEADEVQLRQVVMNLILNASEAIGEADGHIEVSTGSWTRMQCSIVSRTTAAAWMAWPGPKHSIRSSLRSSRDAVWDWQRFRA